MDLVFLAFLLFVGVIAVLGVLVVLVVLVASSCLLWYGKFYHSGAEFKATAGAFCPSWRRGRIWQWLKYLLRHKQPFFFFGRHVAPVVYACQPHGTLALSSALTLFSGDLDTEPDAPTLLVVHSAYFAVPLVRELMLALGCIHKSRESIEYALRAGYSVAVLPGGVYEMGPPTVPEPRLLGIVRLCYALKDFPLVPVFLSGEEECWWLWHTEPRWMRAARAWTLRKCGYGVFNWFFPRVWNWPTLQPFVGPDIRPAELEKAGFEGLHALRGAFNAARAGVREYAQQQQLT